MATGTLEERVQKLQNTLQEMQKQIAAQVQNVPVQKRGWRWFVDIYADSPDFDEVVRIGQEWRDADRPQEEG